MGMVASGVLDPTETPESEKDDKAEKCEVCQKPATKQLTTATEGVEFTTERRQKMKKYIAVAATKNKVTENWPGTPEFSDSALSSLAKTAPGKRILLEFDEEKPIGSIVDAENKNGRLVLTVELRDGFQLDTKHRIVPCFVVHDDTWGDLDAAQVRRIIKTAESFDYGLTITPLETDLPEIKEL